MTAPRPFLDVGKLDSDLLAALLSELARDASVVVGPGIGCDVAVIDTGADDYLLLKCDPITFATDEIGYYAVTVNVNDIATAGGRPRWFLATLLLPETTTTPALVRTIYDQLTRACAHYGVLLVGGHTEVTHGLDRPVCMGTLVGEVARERLVTGRGAQVGDTILMTKAVAVEGTALIAREKRPELVAAGFSESLLDRSAAMLHDPGIGVLAEAQAACDAAVVHAMHDPTEGGLATALWEMAVAAEIGLRVEAEAIPCYPETERLCQHFGLDPLGLIASGSLLIAVAPADAPPVIRACEARGIACTPIARAVEAAAGCRLTRAGTEPPLTRFDQDEIGKLFAAAD